MTTRATRTMRGASDPTPQPAATPRPPLRQMIRRLLVAGCTPAEATNLVGLSVGLRPVAAGWTLGQIERLRFLRYLVETGRLAA